MKIGDLLYVLIQSTLMIGYAVFLIISIVKTMRR